MGLPFQEIVNDGFHHRTFRADIDSGELTWHRDREDRLVEAIEQTDWMIQLDNQLPQKIESVFIPAGTWHRVIKGTKSVTIRVKKYIKF